MPHRTCSVDGCSKGHHARGLCLFHYNGIRHRKSLPPKAPRLCSVDGCERRHHARGWCAVHHGRWRRHGDPMGGSTPKIFFPANLVMRLRFMSLGCVEFTGWLDNHGYGVLWAKGR